jgi:SAM-dependent methyltransferase
MPKELPNPRALWGPGVSKPIQAKRYLNYQALKVTEEIDAVKVLQIGCGLGDSLFFLEESRDGKYSGITSQSSWVGRAREISLKKGTHQKIRFFYGDFKDPRTYRTFPGQDLLLLFDSIAVQGLDVITASGPSLRMGGRVLISGIFAPNTSNLGYPNLERLIQLADSEDLEIMNQLDLSSSVKSSLIDGLKRAILTSKDPLSVDAQIQEEAKKIIAGELSYHYLEFYKRS